MQTLREELGKAILRGDPLEAMEIVKAIRTECPEQIKEILERDFGVFLKKTKYMGEAEAGLVLLAVKLAGRLLLPLSDSRGI